MNEFRLRDDPGWVVKRVFAAPATNGDNDGERWEVISQDGTKYTFGLGSIPNGGPQTNSVFTVPVYELTNVGRPGTTCYNPSSYPDNSWCMQGWRWNLDRIEDANGNVVSFLYQQELNSYGLQGHPATPVQYVRGGWLSQVRYTQRLGQEGTSAPTVVDFTVQNRCLYVDATCDSTYPPSVANNTLYPDVPVDLMCSAVPCAEVSPTFFTTKRLAQIKTRNWASTPPEVYTDVRLIQFVHEFVGTGETGVNSKLWLRSIQELNLEWSFRS